MGLVLLHTGANKAENNWRGRVHCSIYMQADVMTILDCTSAAKAKAITGGLDSHRLGLAVSPHCTRTDLLETASLRLSPFLFNCH